LQLSSGIVVAAVQTDLTDDVIVRFQHDLLAFVHRHAASGVVVDLSGIDIVDASEFSQLRRLIDMASLLGARTILTGLGAGIIASLVDAGADIDGIEGALHVDDALSRLQSVPEFDEGATGTTTETTDAESDPEIDD
jgi:rsbT antagonist protein RsbS